MEAQYIKKIRAAATRGAGAQASDRAELFDHCAVLVLLYIIEKGHGAKAFETLANAFPQDMQEPLASWIQEQRTTLSKQQPFYSPTILE